MGASVAMTRGVVLFFNDIKGFGFLRPDGLVEGDGGDVFIHYTAIDANPARRRSLLKGQRVEFDTARGERGLFAVVCRVVVD